MSWLPTFASTALQVVSLLSNVVGNGGGGGGDSGQPIDRNDDVVAAASDANVDDLDIAMGTLMAYGGKYLRQLGAWAFEYAAQKPAETLNESALPTGEQGEKKARITRRIESQNVWNDSGNPKLTKFHWHRKGLIQLA